VCTRTCTCTHITHTHTHTHTYAQYVVFVCVRVHVHVCTRTRTPTHTPGVALHIEERASLDGFNGQHAPDKVLAVCRHKRGAVEFALDYSPAQVLVARPLKREVPTDHGIQHDPQRPDIDPCRRIGAARHNFRGCVRWRSACLYIYIYVYICMYTHTHTHTHTHTQTHTHTHTNTHTYMYVYQRKMAIRMPCVASVTNLPCVASVRA